MKRILLSALATTLLFGCADSSVGDMESFVGETQPNIMAAEPTSIVLTSYSGNHRIYGYTVDVKKGAKIAAEIEIGDDLYATLGVFGPYQDRQIWGDALYESEGDESGTLKASAVAPEDGTYLFAFRMTSRPAAEVPYQARFACKGGAEKCGIVPAVSSAGCDYKSGTVFVDSMRGEQKLEHCHYTIRRPIRLASLEVGEGVTIDATNASIGVDGGVSLIGSADHPIEIKNISLRGNQVTLQHVTTTGKVTANTLIAEDCVFRKGGVDVVKNVTLKRSLIEGASIGLRIQNPQTGLIEDSVISKNQTGIYVGTRHTASSCNPPAPPQATRYDPVIRYSDIVDNRTAGIFIAAENTLIQVEHSNLIRNRLAVDIRIRDIGEGSFFRNNNFFTNQTSPFLRSFHRSGFLAVQKNHWGTGTGAELSPRWSFCNGIEVDSFGGIASTEVQNAGPRLETLVPDVHDACWKVEEEAVEATE